MTSAGLSTPKRRLTTIMVADMVDSTGAMARDEEAAVARFAACLDAVASVVTSRDGRVFATAGDALLAEFPSPVNALRAAMEGRTALMLVPGAGPGDMRFGLNLADVVEVDDDLRGDGVNLAARIQAEAAPGDIWVSSAVVEQVRRVSPCSFDDLGEHRLKGIDEPVRLFRVRGPMERYVFQQAPTRMPAPATLRPHSVAVVPFRVASEDREAQRYFAEGLTEDLILELARRRRLFVSSRSASFAVEGADPVEVGMRLGVRYVVSGSVRRQGTRIRLGLALIETESGRTVWSERFDRSFDDLFEAMDEMTGRIAATVYGRIEQADMTAARRRPPASLDAYECYLRGVEAHRLGNLTDTHVHEAVDWFRRAADADPGFAAALAMEVCSASVLPEFDLRRGERRMMRALELDPHDAEVNRIMGSIRMVSGDFQSARHFHERALELAPSDAYIVARCAAFHIFVGEPERGLELLAEAAALDPFLPVWCIEEKVAALYSMSRFEAALDAARGLPFQTRRTRLYRAAARVALGDLPRARQLMAEAIAESPGLTKAFVEANESFADRTVLETLLDRLGQAGLPAANPAMVDAVATGARAGDGERGRCSGSSP
jgi:adenylate cyclase